MPRVRLAVLDVGSFVRTSAGELRPESDRFNRFVEAVARSGTFAEVRYIVPVRHLRIWEVEPPFDPVDESALKIAPTRPGSVLSRNEGAIDEAVAASDVVLLRLPAGNSRVVLAAARSRGVPAVGWLEGGASESMPIITPGPELFASVVTADEIEATRAFETPSEHNHRRIVWAISEAPHPSEVRRVAAAIAELQTTGNRVSLVVLCDRPITGSKALETLATDAVENYGYVGDRRSYMDLLRHGDILVHLSQAEGLPTVVVDALAAGLPVVAAETAALREILGDGERGRLVLDDDASALARAIDSVLDDARLTQMRESALRWAAANTTDIHATRFGERLHELFPTLHW
jgi:hypothetical protein